MSYNTLRDANPAAATVSQAIGEESVGGIARPIDILMLQEQEEPFTTTQGFVNLLNGLYGPGVYARGSVITGPSTSSLRQGVVYNTRTVQLLEETDIARSSIAGSSPPREALRAKFRPVGYDQRSDFYVYNAHFKAGSSASDINRRAVEATNLRRDADALGADTPVIFLGDFNLRNDGSSSGLADPPEPAFQTLIAPGPAESFDPVADIAPAQWKNNFAARFVHTHGRGDVDDRFDFQLPSTEWADGEGLDFIEGSYRAFGNNGSTYNQAVNSRNNTYPLPFPASSNLTRDAVLDALFATSDHLPVVADYQVPAVLSASLVPLPATFEQAAVGELTLSIANTADVVAPSGADELDYTLVWSGDNTGSVSGSDLADGIAATVRAPLDTSTPGTYTTQFTLSSDSEGVMGLGPAGELAFTLSYEVVAPDVPGDFNVDGRVDAADYTTWRDGLTQEYTEAGYSLWVQGYAGANGLPAALTTPEPSTAALVSLVVGMQVVSGRRRRGG